MTVSFEKESESHAHHEWWRQQWRAWPPGRLLAPSLDMQQRRRKDAGGRTEGGGRTKEGGGRREEGGETREEGGGRREEGGGFKSKFLGQLADSVRLL